MFSKLSKMSKLGLLLVVSSVAHAQPATVADSSPLSISVAPNMSYVLAGDTSSCADIAHATMTGARMAASVKGMHLDFYNFSLAWSSLMPLHLDEVKVAVTDANIQGGAYTCSVTGVELQHLVGMPNAVVYGPTILNSHGMIRGLTACSLSCGEIKLVDTTKGISAQATITASGHTAPYDQSAGVPVTATTDAMTQYVP